MPDLTEPPRPSPCQLSSSAHTAPGVNAGPMRGDTELHPPQPPYLQQRRLAEQAGEGVELPDKQPQLIHRQLVGAFPSSGAVPATTRS